MRLYVVDDAAVMRAAIGHAARALGHAIVGEAASLQDALAGLAAIVVDAVLVDGRLPGAQPEAVVRALRFAVPDAAIIVIAALDETPLVSRARAAGATGALLRPVSRSGLAIALALTPGDSANASA